MASAEKSNLNPAATPFVFNPQAANNPPGGDENLGVAVSKKRKRKLKHALKKASAKNPLGDDSAAVNQPVGGAMQTFDKDEDGLAKNKDEPAKGNEHPQEPAQEASEVQKTPKTKKQMDPKLKERKRGPFSIEESESEKSPSEKQVAQDQVSKKRGPFTIDDSSEGNIAPITLHIYPALTMYRGGN